MNAMKRAWPAVVALAVPWWPAWAQTQTPTPPDNPALSEARQQWREANERVGEFPRGHIDLLKWEQRNLPPAATPASCQAWICSGVSTVKPMVLPLATVAGSPLIGLVTMKKLSR